MMMHLKLFSVFLLLSLLPFQSSAIKCYAGSRGFINGKLEQKFIQETCDEGMLYCIESYTGDFDEVTASCQHLGTNMRLLDLCQSKNPKKINEDLTTRCCKTDLCNNIGVEKKKLKKIEN
ncbi:hypothetical protein L5515_012165 [Caenorhabditis briggsae]|uniref:Uncharacterized protein n=1 Tax=Caenorhabditis briggsae TaxID=6238 RepID=A0AAE9ADT1_CAEBR|nr:hypothetical protein L3Y34_005070 [Caenorhabditis briggsae]UMM30177.1 hypothetical protein L5515_012165 [Caenorhabditis briggsae]